MLEHLAERTPGQYEEGQLRTVQRRLKRWRAEEGPPKDLFFPQAHRPGEAMQTDFTWASELDVTIVGERFEFSEFDVRVTQGATIRAKGNVYSVPSRLKGETVRVRIHDDR